MIQSYSFRPNRPKRSSQKGKSVSNDNAAKWEGQPLTSIDDADDHATTLETSAKDQIPQQPWYKDPKKFAKVLFPHIALLVALLSYTAIGAVILQAMEADVELSERRQKLDQIFAQYEVILNQSWELKDSGFMTRDHWNQELRQQLRALSAIHEEAPMPLNSSDIRTKWTFPSAVLYILTILTTCGYDHVGPLTDVGKVFSVGFALVGIPLMFITAADIGKFLCEVMMWGIRHITQALLFLKSKLVCLNFFTKQKQGATSADQDQKQRAPNRSLSQDFDLFDVDDGLEYQSLWFPVGAYIGLICFYCALGSLIYCQYEEGWWFIKGFHFSFNTITTVGLGNIDVTDWVYLGLNIIYVIVGLAVVTMCVDLASTHLKAYFTRIHYFGRGLGVSVELREMMHLMMSIRQKKGGKMTWKDLQKLMEHNFAGFPGRPFIPRNIHFWRYIDETSSSACTTMRQNSIISESNIMNASMHSSSYRHPSPMMLRAEPQPQAASNNYNNNNNNNNSNGYGKLSPMAPV